MAQIVLKQQVLSDGSVSILAPPGFIVAAVDESVTFAGIPLSALVNVASSATITGSTSFSMPAAGRYRLKATMADFGDVFIDAIAYESAALAKILAPPSGEPMTDARRLRIFAALANGTTWFDGTAASLVSRSIASFGG